MRAARFQAALGVLGTALVGVLFGLAPMQGGGGAASVSAASIGALESATTPVYTLSGTEHYCDSAELGNNGEAYYIVGSVSAATSFTATLPTVTEGEVYHFIRSDADMAELIIQPQASNGFRWFRGVMANDEALWGTERYSSISVRGGSGSGWQAETHGRWLEEDLDSGTFMGVYAVIQGDRDIPDVTEVTIDYADETGGFGYDYGGFYASGGTTDRLTIPADGFYEIAFRSFVKQSSSLAESDSQVYAHLFTSADTRYATVGSQRQKDAANSSTAIVHNGSAVFAMEEGDYVTWNHYLDYSSGTRSVRGQIGGSNEWSYIAITRMD